MQRSSKRHPFVLDPPPKQRMPWRSIATIAILATGLTLAIPVAARAWMVNSLTRDLGSLPADAQHARLAMLADLGESGIHVLVAKMADPDTTIALAAYRVLAESQDDWATRWPDGADALHHRLATALEEHCESLSAERRAWVEQLADQVLMDTLQSRTRRGQAAYASAIRLLAKCAPAPSHADQPIDYRVASRPTLPPLDDAPPNSEDLEQSRRAPDGSNGLRGPIRPDQDEVGSDPSFSGHGSVPAELVPPSTSRLILPRVAPQKIEASPPAVVTITSREPNRLRDDPVLDAPPVGASSLQVTSLAPYATRDLIDLLRGSSPPLVQSVREELTKRGFDQAALAAAEAMVSNHRQVRMDLIDRLPKQSDVDPRPFLLWMCEDEDRQVRVAAINLLGTMDDPVIKKALRDQLSLTTDPVVATQLRVALREQ